MVAEEATPISSNLGLRPPLILNNDDVLRRARPIWVEFRQSFNSADDDPDTVVCEVPSNGAHEIVAGFTAQGQHGGGLLEPDGGRVHEQQLSRELP